MNRMTPDPSATEAALRVAEPILALLYFRGIVDSEHNREDVAQALTAVRAALGIGGHYPPSRYPPLDRQEAQEPTSWFQPTSWFRRAR